MVYPETPFQRGLKTNQSILLHWNNHRIKEKNQNTVITNELTTYARAFAKIQLNIAITVKISKCFLSPIARLAKVNTEVNTVMPHRRQEL